jgi:hypothetical protein
MLGKNEMAASLSMKVINCKYITPYRNTIYTSYVLTIYHIKDL